MFELAHRLVGIYKTSNVSRLEMFPASIRQTDRTPDYSVQKSVSGLLSLYWRIKLTSCRVSPLITRIFGLKRSSRVRENLSLHPIHNGRSKVSRSRR